jgi:hypothetical protein
MATYDYQLCGLRLRTPFELSGLTAAAEPGTAVHVQVRFGAVPDVLPGAVTYPTWQVTGDEFLLAVPAVGRYWVRHGQEIVVERAEGAEDRDIQVSLLGSAFGAICHQRDLLPLHASAVRAGSGCIAFSGPSGAGKSTFAAFLTRRGYPLVTDDICLISLAEGTVQVAPGFPQVKLWSDGLDHLQHDKLDLARVRRKLDKYHVPVTGGVEARQLPLLRLYLLEKPTARAPLVRLTGLDAVRAVNAATYRLPFVHAMGRSAQHFRLCTEVARSSQVFRMSRPQDFTHLERMLEMLEADWRLAS